MAHCLGSATMWTRDIHVPLVSPFASHSHATTDLIHFMLWHSCSCCRAGRSSVWRRVRCWQRRVRMRRCRPWPSAPRAGRSESCQVPLGSELLLSALQRIGKRALGTAVHAAACPHTCMPDAAVCAASRQACCAARWAGACWPAAKPHWSTDWPCPRGRNSCWLRMLNRRSSYRYARRLLYRACCPIHVHQYSASFAQELALVRRLLLPATRPCCRWSWWPRLLRCSTSWLSGRWKPPTSSKPSSPTGKFMSCPCFRFMCMQFPTCICAHTLCTVSVHVDTSSALAAGAARVP